MRSLFTFLGPGESFSKIVEKSIFEFPVSQIYQKRRTCQSAARGIENMQNTVQEYILIKSGKKEKIF